MSAYNEPCAWWMKRFMSLQKRVDTIRMLEDDRDKYTLASAFAETNPYELLQFFTYLERDSVQRVRAASYERRWLMERRNQWRELGVLPTHFILPDVSVLELEWPPAWRDTENVPLPDERAYQRFNRGGFTVRTDEGLMRQWNAAGNWFVDDV